MMSLDFRAEIFNLTNTPLLGKPNTTVGNAAFGTHHVRQGIRA